MVGLEIDEARAIAVRMDDRGVVLARARADAPGGDLTKAARRALDTVEAASGTAIGVAAAIPESPALAPVIAALAPRVSGRLALLHAIPSGVAAAVAEAWIGAARGAQDVVYFSCADHTVAGIIRGGAPVLGTRGRAASVGWLALNPVEREDYRKIGCLEAEVAAAGIVRRLVWRVKSGDRSSVSDTVNGDFTALTAQQVLDGARQNDGVSISVIRDTAKYLGMAAANLVALADPEMLVLGGIMTSAADLLLEPVRAELGRRLPKPMMDALAIQTAALGEDGAAIGAAHLVSPAVR
jgi:predicted NBD/HSP70 family sugar kinase